MGFILELAAYQADRKLARRRAGPGGAEEAICPRRQEKQVAGGAEGSIRPRQIGVRGCSSPKDIAKHDGGSVPRM